MSDTGAASAGSSSGGLRRYLLVRLALAPLFLFVILTVLFVLLRVAPGDPVAASLGGRASQADIERAREASGLNDPILKQYVDYLSGVVRGDFGDPVHRPALGAREIISDRFPATVELTIVRDGARGRRRACWSGPGRRASATVRSTWAAASSA